MLVLSRKPGEVIVVPQCELTITVISVEGNNIRLGFSAPDEVDVYRKEVWQRICQASLKSPLPTPERHRRDYQ
jgi:carbon storage regulator